MSEPPVCADCGMVDPPPDMTCPGRPGESLMVLTLRDHRVGTDRGCPACGRLVAACAARPCSTWRAMGYDMSGSDEEGGE